ncbi:hypothetical protein ILUMI_12358 [Ignelater luminosus]|uniref:oleoyl-[acyl-carrier-protein] hydrolase n=1 Tax=Ignelater luminosus TaxID=2038154 RepID=A0A8K0GCD8_IGNLU|nr:hypothetical protein ILUMI_12358 [Ignelater luminosus]
MGHSVGELGCAYADGCLSAEQMVLCAYSRGRASLEADLIKGMMAAVGIGYSQIKDQCPSSIEVACHNSSDNSTISGPTEDMEVFVNQLQGRGIFARLVNVSNIAYHSRYIKPAAPLLLKYLQEVIPEPLPRSSKWISTSIPEDQWNTDLARLSSAEYHTNNLLSSVLFEEGAKHIPQQAIVIEIAPHGLLQAILKRSLNATITNIPLTNKTSNNGLKFLLAALGKLYLTGLDLDISVLYPKVEYPVGRGTKSLVSLVHWEHSEAWASGTDLKANYWSTVRDLNVSLKHNKYKELIEHQLQNAVVIPISTYLAILYELLNGIRMSTMNDVIFENLQFKNVVRVPEFGSAPVYVMMQRGSGSFEIYSGRELIGSGRIQTAEGRQLFTNITPIEIPENCLELNTNDVYSEFYQRSHQYRGVFKSIKTLQLVKEGSVGIVQWNNNWPTFIEAMIQQCLFHRGECNQKTLMVSSIQSIALSLLDLQMEPSDLKVSYDYATGIVSTSGIQISGIKEKPLEVVGEESCTISYNAIEVKALFNGKHQCIESGINLGLQITVDNFKNKTFHSVTIVEIRTNNKLLENSIKNVINKNSHFNPNASTVQDIKEIFVSQAEPVYVIINNVPDKDCINLVISSHVFLLAHTDNNTLANPEITQVAEFTVDGTSYSLIRKSANPTTMIVPIKTDTLISEDLLCENLSWVSQLKTALASAKERRVYLVFSVVPTDGIYNFVRNASILPGMQNVRFVFILDKGAAEFTEKESVYKKVFKNDLNLIVIKNSCVGTYISTPAEFQNDTTNTSSTVSNITANIRVDYIGINAKDETLILKNEYKPELGYIDYSGVTSCGERRMGLARLDLELCKLELDPVLWWNIPSKWSLEDAATVPHAHVLAYYALVVVADIKPTDTVLVHGGCSAYGLAAIYIARKVGCAVITTVTSEKQRVFIKKQYMFLDYIFSACDTSFEPRILLATAGKGVQVVLNCLSGNMLHATLRCTAEFGKIVQIGKSDVEENTEVGTRLFLRCVSLCCVTAENVFNAPLDVKQKIQELVTEGLKSVTVRPLFKTVEDHQDVASILRDLKQPEHIGKKVIKLSNNTSLTQLNIKRAFRFICDSETFYLIYGGTAEMKIDVVEWLIFRGTKKLAISYELESQLVDIKRRLKVHQTYYDLEVLFIFTKAHTRDGAFKLLSEVCCRGTIGAVFVLPNEECSTKIVQIKTVQHLDCALKTVAPKALLINFVNNAAGVCHLRADSGFPTKNIQWEKCLEFPDVMYGLDNALMFTHNDIFIKDEKYKHNIEESVQSLYKKLGLLLPSSISNLKEETKNAPITPDFIPLPSLCSQIERDVPSVFIIPGMFNTRGINDLASKLMHPVFCANFPKKMLPLKTIAVLLANRMREIHPRGPYNIIGVSYGGILAIEIAKILEQENCKTQVQFLDGAPDTIQGVLKHLGDGYNREIRYLCQILNLTNPEIIKGLINLPAWKTRLDFALNYHKSSSEEKEFLKEILTILKQHFDEISNFQPSNVLIQGKTILLRPTGSNKYDDCGLRKYCKEEVLLNVVDGNHNGILKNKKAANIINYEVIC